MNTITIAPLAAQAAALGGNGYADQNTPLVRNCWYVAARSGEVGRELMHRRFLGVDVAMYRTLAGMPVAVRNRCPHRSFPLASGGDAGYLVAIFRRIHHGGQQKSENRTHHLV